MGDSWLLPGTMVEHFSIMRPLGKGGMSEVYLARDTRLRRKVALKLIHPGTPGSQATVDQFLFEAQATARFSHPHIITVFAVGTFEGRPYLALEYLEGKTLRQRLDDGRLGVQESLRIGLAVAEALAEAHRNGILHRDLKPENVIVPKDGRLRVLDFGLAKLLPGREPSSEPAVDDATVFDTLHPISTRSHGPRGTPAYMAPEQWLQSSCTSATDVWALGTILFEMIAGRRPFPETSLSLLSARICAPDPAPSLLSGR